MADKIFYNGQIYTMDSCRRICEAFAVCNDKLVYVGDSQNAMSYKKEDTLLIDLKGRSVLPGLGDAHLHASSTCELIFSFNMYNIELSYDAKPSEAMNIYQNIIRKNIKQNHSVKVLRGTGWDPSYFMSDLKSMPTASDIDKVCSNIPVILRSYDHHYLWVNSKVLEDSGISKDTPSPRNGIIWRDENMNPTGIFQENSAIDLILKSVPYGDYSIEEYEKGIMYYQKNFGNAYGTTLIFDALATENAIQAYKNLAVRDELNMRVTAVYAVDPEKPLSQLDHIIKQRGSEDVGEIFRRNTVKVFADGTGLSIYMDKPYEPEYLKTIGMKEGYNGHPQWTESELREIFMKANGAGMPVHVHCMGDGAAKMTLDAIEYTKNQGIAVEKMRNTIAHFMAIKEEDKKRMAKLNVIASVQPIWGCYYSMTETIITEMLGDKRARAQYPMGSFKKEGIKMAAGTDFPVIIPPSPFLGFKIGTTRTVNKAHPEYKIYRNCPLGPKNDPLSEAVDLNDMIEMYSIGPAYQTFCDDITGSLQNGKSADFVILDRSISDTSLEDLDSLKAESVYFRGKKIF